MSTAKALTPTSYALLGLLATRSWTSYELAAQMDRTMNRFWPRAKSKLYEEPKKLVALGLAVATDDRVGRRPRTVYEITPAGRQALAEWLTEPGQGPVLEWEQLVKVFFADSGTRDDLMRTLADVRGWAHSWSAHNVAVGRSYLDGAGPFPQRAAVLVLTSRFLDDLLETVDSWAAWAADLAEEWPDDPSQATAAMAELEQTVRNAEARLARWEQSPPPLRDRPGQRSAR